MYKVEFKKMLISQPLRDCQLLADKTLKIRLLPHRKVENQTDPGTIML